MSAADAAGLRYIDCQSSKKLFTDGPGCPKSLGKILFSANLCYHSIDKKSLIRENLSGFPQPKRSLKAFLEKADKVRTKDADNKEVLVLVSGGLDSTACLHFYLDFGRPPEAFFINYGQPAARREKVAAKLVCDYYKVPLRIFRLPAPSISTPGFITGRNLFLGAAALLLKPDSVRVIAMGIHAGTGYPDCTPEFLQRLQALYDLSSNNYVLITAPFIDWTKAEIWEYCYINKIPVELTYSCELGTDPPCGSCLSCRDREVINAGTTAKHQTSEWN